MARIPLHLRGAFSHLCLSQISIIEASHTQVETSLRYVVVQLQEVLKLERRITHACIAVQHYYLVSLGLEVAKVKS